MRPTRPRSWFTRLTKATAHAAGRPATFLMVFLIQSTQNRDVEAIQVKLDEIIRAIGTAKNEVLDLEELEEADLDRIRKSYEELARKARAEQRRT